MKKWERPNLSVLQVKITETCRLHGWRDGVAPTAEQLNSGTKETWGCICGVTGSAQQILDHLREMAGNDGHCGSLIS